MKKTVFLTISAAAIVALPNVSNASTIHNVLPGESLSKIAIKYNISIQQLIEWNQLESDRIYVGQQLTISNLNKEKGSLVSSNKKSSKPIHAVKVPVIEDTIKDEVITYKIAAGDTLFKIASKFNTTVSLIKEWNSLKNDVIYVGQSLKIFSIKSEDVEAVVEYGKEELSKTDLQISNQLKRETPIEENPSESGLALYNKAISLASSLKGIPYLFGGNTVSGFDCSGFINYVFSNSGMKIVRKSSLDYFLYDTVKVTNPIPGDVVFFKNTYISGISHMGIYLGNDQFIHAGSKGIEISKLSYDYWKTRFVEFKRFNEAK